MQWRSYQPSIARSVTKRPIGKSYECSRRQFRVEPGKAQTKPTEAAEVRFREHTAVAKEGTLDEGLHKADAHGCGSSLSTLPRTANDFRAPFPPKDGAFFAARRHI